MASADHQRALHEGVNKNISHYLYPHVLNHDMKTLKFQDTCAFRGAMGGVMGGGMGVAFGLLMQAMNPPGMSGSMAPGMGGMPNPMNPVLATGPARTTLPGGIPSSGASVAPSTTPASTTITSLATSAHIRPLGPHPLPAAPVIPISPMSGALDPLPGGTAGVPEPTSWQQVKAMARDTGRQAKGNFKTWGIMSSTFTLTECMIEKTRGESDSLNGIFAGCTTGAVLAARSGPQAMAIGCVGFASFSYAMERFMHSMG